MREFQKDLEYFSRMDAQRLARLDPYSQRRFSRLYQYARSHFTGFWDNPPDNGSIFQKMAFIQKKASDRR